MKLVVGLGNPGKKYKNTRHNVGFWVIDELAKEKPEGLISIKPKTFMNQSGKAVKKIISNSKFLWTQKGLPGGLLSNLIVIHDDIDIPLGEFKIQKGRSSAGHKGIQSIIDELGTKDFWRVRIGICPKTGKPKNVEKFVLQKFTKEEEKIIKEVIKDVMKKLGSSPQSLP